MTFEVNFCSEYYKLLFFTLKLCAKEVILSEMLPQIRIFRIEILKPVSITKVAEIVVFPQMLIQFLALQFLSGKNTQTVHPHL